jgi:hypothetical protein
MKKQLLIAAVAASMTSVAMADVSISGSAKVNAKGGDYSHEADVTVTGKSGDTTVTMQIGADNAAFTTEQVYATSSVAGVTIKAGQWKSGKGELGVNSGNTADRISATTAFGGITLNYEDGTGAGGTSTKISGEIAGVALSYKAKASNKSETTASGSMGGVSASFHTKDNAGTTDTAVTLSTEVQGVTLTYVDVKSTAAGGTSMDGFFGSDTAVTKATGLGLSTTIAGNKVTFKSNDVTKTAKVNTKKLIITRALASGATFEATYADVEGGTDSLDLELAVSF